MQTQVTLTKHYQDSGESNGRSWTRNDFVAADGQTRFKTFDGDVASKAKSLLNVPTTITYRLQERGQYVDNILEDIVPVSGEAPAPAPQQSNGHPTAAAVEPAMRGVDRGGGIARAIEFCSVAGISVLEAYDNGSLFDLADTFAEYSAFGTKPGAASPSSVGAGTEGVA